MYTIQRANERGHTSIGWLDSWHSFSFGDYYDPNNMGYRSLRVINDDYIAPSMGFGTHGHRDMEIVTYVLKGQLQHKDSLGNGDVLKPGDVQRMSAGSGIRHSEFNPSTDEQTHLLQIWLEPKQPGGPARYEQKHFTSAERTNVWCPVVTEDGRNGTLPLQTDVAVFASILDKDASLSYQLPSQRHAYLHIAIGEVQFGNETIRAGDSLRIHGEKTIAIQAMQKSELLLFDLA